MFVRWESHGILYTILLFSMMAISISFVSGCQTKKDVQFHGKASHLTNELEKKLLANSFSGKEIIPLTSGWTGEWNEISGWLNEKTVLYFTDTATGGNLYTYDMFSGENKLLYETGAPIVEISLSPSQKYILVHTAPTTYSAELLTIDQTGKVLLEKELASFELSFQWNPNLENELFVSLFKEDWTFETMLIDIATKTTTQYEIADPFPQWIEKDTVAFLQWNINEPTLTAPLVQYNLKTNQTKRIKENIIDFTSFSPYLFTIDIDEEKTGTGMYSFTHQINAEKTTFTIPLLTRYSGWFVPFHAKNEGKQLFYTLRPLRSANIDTYGDKFHLVSLDVEKGEETVVLEGLDNAPLSLSPDGNYLLYGFQFEQLIDLQKKEIIDFLPFN